MKTQSIFLRLLAHHGVAFDEVLSAVRERTIGPHTLAFRSSLPPPSDASLHNPRASQVRFPEQLPYMSGLAGDDLYMTSIAIDDRITWYARYGPSAHLVIRGLDGTIPKSVIISMVGRPVDEIIRHPVLSGNGWRILHAHGNAASLQLTIDMDWEEVPEPEMRRAA